MENQEKEINVTQEQIKKIIDETLTSTDKGIYLLKERNDEFSNLIAETFKTNRLAIKILSDQFLNIANDLKAEREITTILIKRLNKIENKPKKSFLSWLKK